MTLTAEATEVVRVLPVWKTKRESHEPCASRMSVPVNCADEAKQ
jgi:hypothetical protein